MSQRARGAGLAPPKSSMRMVIVDLLFALTDAVAMGQDPQALHRLMNLLAAYTAPYTEGDGEFQRRAEELASQVPQGQMWPDHLRYEWLRATMCALRRKGMLDVPETPGASGDVLVEDEPVAGGGGGALA